MADDLDSTGDLGQGQVHDNKIVRMYIRTKETPREIFIWKIF